MMAAQGRGGRVPNSRPLRVASHNLGGLRVTEGRAAARLEAAVQLWAELKLDVVCLQETHHVTAEDQALTQHALHSASERRHQPGWVIAAHSWSSVGPRTAGVAILIRANLLAPSAMQPLPTPAGVPTGWFTACQLLWGGHRLQICSIYMPQASREGATSLRQQLIQTCLAPTAASAAAEGTLVMWCGDFNFVENPALDCSAGPAGRTGDAVPTQHLRTAGTAAAMVDSFRTVHTDQREYTHLYRAPHPGGSRLDRIYVPEAACPLITRATIHTASPSDHRPALLHLAAHPQPPAQKIPRRLRLFILAHPDLKRALGLWLDEQAAAAPVGEEQAHQAILDWWPVFKRRLTAQVARLNREALIRRSRPTASVQQLVDAARAAANALDANPQDAACLAEAVDAQVAVQRAMHAAAGAEVLAARREQISDGERPTPGLTRLVHETCGGNSGGGGPGPTILRDPRTGQLAKDPGRVAQIIADYWRGVSALPPVTELPPAVKQQAQVQVMEALRAHPMRLPEDPEDALGRPRVSSTEVLAALKATPRGKAPGWDGLPAELYKAFNRQLAPLLAALYTAIGTTGRMPACFTDGIIKVLYKKGDPTQPGNYRPITLLNTDYRTLAKVLAARLGPALHTTVSAEQTAFLPGRLIGANIFALRHLPHLLRRQGREAIVAFLDFAKAYDTVHRDFLLEAMKELGASENMCKWIRTLLSDTQAQALVGGRLSQPVHMAAGVRQGCPLAPLLYLFVAQALLSWLQRNNMGIRLDPTDADRTTAVQFADDGQVLLEGDEAVPYFLGVMNTFAQATGQRLNCNKVELLRIGAVRPPQPASQPAAAGQVQGPAVPPAQPTTVAGLQVVPATTALGIRFSNSPPLLEPDQQRALAAAGERMHRLTVPQLSVFGRCAGVSAYALQLNTYHWEHGGLPVNGAQEQLESWAAAAGDRRVSPMTPRQRLTGIPRQLLYGHPTAGGFGLLPLTAHTRAREAVWATRLARSVGPLTNSQPHPWTRITALFLRRHHPLLSPSSVLTMGTPNSSTTQPTGMAQLPTDIRRIMEALSYLPPVQDVESVPLPAAGDWCFNIPLWGNPLLPNASQTTTASSDEDAMDTADPDFIPEEEAITPVAAGTWPGLDRRHTRLAACTALRTVGDAVRIGRAASMAPDGAGWLGWVQTHLAPQALDGFRRGPTLTAIRRLLADINTDWREAAANVLDHPEREAGLETEDTLRSRIVERMGWRFSGSLTVKLSGLTVKLATQLQLQEVETRRARLHTAYEQEAREQPGAADAADTVGAAAPASCVQGMLRRLWPIKWEREHKETLWRLAVDGVPLPGNAHLHNIHPEPCGCGQYSGGGSQQCTPRAHHFWNCTVAKAVIQQIETHVPGPITRANMWLAEAPTGVQQCVWDVVALAALTAMERARVGLRAATRPGAAAGDPGAPPPVEVAKARAILEFWQRVKGFTELGVPRRGWDGVGTNHPIISIVDGRLCCVQPAGELGE